MKNGNSKADLGCQELEHSSGSGEGGLGRV